MSYQVLARKWRPSNFSQVAGQAHVLKSLINALDNQRLHHAYLFTGTRGVGKTTLARILAKCLNCEAGISSTPCESCDSCREISEGRFIDLIEVDAASRTKVEDTRELLENVQYTPSRGRYKVYLIDEVHMLSTHSFNALLKTLEEPPPHVKFLFATTDPQKLPITVLSRCLQFNLKNLSPQLITEYLVTVLSKEKIDSSEEALWQIAAAANGSMRDALTLVDQAVSYCQGEITTAGVIEMLGIPEQKKIVSLLQAMSSGEVQKVIEVVKELAEYSPDYVQTLDSLLSALHRIALAQVLPAALDNSLGDKASIQELAGNFSAEDVQLYYQLGIKGREDLRLASELRSAFEMLLLRMMVFSPNFTNASKSNAVAGTASKQGDDGAKEPQSEKPAAKTAAKHAGQGASVQAPKEDVREATSDDSQKKKIDPVTPDSEPVSISASLSDSISSTPELKIGSDSEPKKTPEKPLSIPARHANGNGSPKIALTELDHERWLEVYKELKLVGIAGNILANSEVKSVSGNTVQFVLDESQSAVYSTEIIPKLAQAMGDYFNTAIKVVIAIGVVTKETPAMLSQRLKQERHLEMVDEFERDENVQELLKRFSGTLAKDTIAPLKD